MRWLIDLLTATELWAALLGAAVGGGFTVFGVHLQQSAVAKTRRAEANAEADSLMRALRSEITFLYKRYMDEIGQDLDQHVQSAVYESEWRARSDYFVIYRANAANLGLLPDEDLRLSVITAYAMATAHLECLEFNNELLARDRAAIAVPNPMGLARRLEFEAPAYAANLVASHDQMKAAVQDALARLNAAIADATIRASDGGRE